MQVQYCKLHSSSFGVPQNRERVFTHAVLSGFRMPSLPGANPALRSGTTHAGTPAAAAADCSRHEQVAPTVECEGQAAPMAATGTGASAAAGAAAEGSQLAATDARPLDVQGTAQHTLGDALRGLPPCCAVELLGIFPKVRTLALAMSHSSPWLHRASRNP